jgi:hypothetical protein
MFLLPYFTIQMASLESGNKLEASVKIRIGNRETKQKLGKMLGLNPAGQSLNIFRTTGLTKPDC